MLATSAELSSDASAPTSPESFQSLAPGDVIGGRYEILALLGSGGMGAVFKARDREVDRLVALKVIRPELANQGTLLERFKQELVLARQITHKNVIRIFDLGGAGSLRFITMEFVEGHDLSSIIRDRQLSIQETIGIIRQVCRALDAAHSESVVHRDLKPQNIMLRDSGKVCVMDFGLAFSTESTGLTQTGMLLGTPAYMSPEQAQGQPVDGRSDIYALGIIFYEMLTGDAPFRADSMIASLLKRTQGPPPDPSTINPAIPNAVSAIVLKSLASDRNARYQSAAEMLRDLDVVAGDSPSTPATLAAPSFVPTPQRRTWKWVSAGLSAVLVIVLMLGLVFRDRLMPKPASAMKPVTVLVADFDNSTGDTAFDNTLESMFNIAMEGASFVNAYNRGQARRISAQLQPGATRLDENQARLVAMREGIGVIVTGSIGRSGDRYLLSVKAVDPVSGKTIAAHDVKTFGREAVLAAIPGLAAPIRKKLGDTTPESVQLAAGAGTFAAASLETVHQYGIAMEQQFAGKMDDALRSFAKAAELDPHFARAYSGMAAVSGNLGRTEEAKKYISLAMQNVARMTERERLRTRGLYFAQTLDLQKCVEEYTSLVKQYPADNIGHNNLANCLSLSRNTSRAVEEARLAVQINPKSAAARNNLSLFASYNGDFQTGEREARAAQQLNSAYAKAYIGLAFAQLGQGHLPEAREAYIQLEKLNPSWAASGLADLAMYEGRFTDAAQILEKAAAADLAANKPEAAAAHFVSLAYAHLLMKRLQPAVAAASTALSDSKQAKIRFVAARIFVEAGDHRARQLADTLGAELQSEPQAYAKLIEGEAATRADNPQQAIKAIREGNQLLDTWIGHFDLGRAYLKAGLFAQADGEFDVCFKRRGEALSLFADESPTYAYFPALYYYQGLAREGLQSPDSGASYRAYVNIRGKAGEDPLLDELRRRAGTGK